MSEVLSGGFKKPECGDMHQSRSINTQSHMRDVLGGLVDLLVVGTDPDYLGVIDGAALTADYVPVAGNVNPDGTFFITIETDYAVYIVGLEDGTQFTITATQSHAYLGQWYPARLLRVLEHGTTGSFSVGY